MQHKRGTFASLTAHSAALVLAAAAVYAVTLDGPFIFDDYLNIVDNPAIKDLSQLWPPSSARWFGQLTFGLNYALGGLDPRGFRIVNLCVHLASTLIVYGFVITTLQSPFLSRRTPEAPSQRSRIIAFLAALIFAIHPLQTQAVAYIVQRFTSLAAMLYLLSVTLYGFFRNRAGGTMSSRRKAFSWAAYGASLLSALLAMKTKEIAFTLPVTLVLYEAAFFGRDGLSGRRRFVPLIPFLLLLPVIPLQYLGSTTLSTALSDISEKAVATTEVSRSAYLFTQIRVLPLYLRLLMLPVNQSFDYHVALSRSMTEPRVIVSLILLVALAGLGAWLFHRSRRGDPLLRLASFGIAWFFLTISVESSFIPLPDLVFEHRMYLPSMALIPGIVAAAFAASAGWRGSQRFLIPGLFLLSLAFGIAASSRNLLWADELRLWQDVAEKNPFHARARNMIGIIANRRGNKAEALASYRRAVEIDPRYAEARVNLGSIYLDQGMPDAALSEFITAVRLQSLDPIDTAILYMNIARYHILKGSADKAVSYLVLARQLTPNEAAVYHYLGIAYRDEGRPDIAEENFRKARQLNPERYGR